MASEDRRAGGAAKAELALAGRPHAGGRAGLLACADAAVRALGEVVHQGAAAVRQRHHAALVVGVDIGRVILEPLQLA